jgi:hypothetical protein
LVWVWGSAVSLRKRVRGSEKGEKEGSDLGMHVDDDDDDSV